MNTRWEHRAISLTCSEHNDTIEADVFGALAVHRTIHMPWTRARWSVTHVPTGRHVSTANTERLARQFVRTVTPLVDWEQATTMPPQSVEFWEAFNAARLRAHNDQYVNEVRL